RFNTRSAPSMSTSPITTLAPSRAKVIAMASPMPDPAPVTMATLFFSSMFLGSRSYPVKQLDHYSIRHDIGHSGSRGDRLLLHATQDGLHTSRQSHPCTRHHR